MVLIVSLSIDWDIMKINACKFFIFTTAYLSLAFYYRAWSCNLIPGAYLVDIVKKPSEDR